MRAGSASRRCLRAGRAPSSTSGTGRGGHGRSVGAHRDLSRHAGRRARCRGQHDRRLPARSLRFRTVPATPQRGTRSRHDRATSPTTSGTPLRRASSPLRARAGSPPCASSTSSCWQKAVARNDPTLGHAGPRKQPRVAQDAECRRGRPAHRRRRKTRGNRDGIEHLRRSLRLHCLLEMLYATGMRVSELVSLPRGVLAGDERVLTIQAARAGASGSCRSTPQPAPRSTATWASASPRRRGSADGCHQVAVPFARRPRPSHAPALRPGSEGARRSKPASIPTASARTCCATPSPATCWTAAPTCARCSSCSAMPTFRRPRSTRTCWRSG